MVHAGPGSDPRAQVIDEVRTEAECPGLKRIGQIGFPFRRIQTALCRRAGELKALFGGVDAEEAHGRAALDMKPDGVAVRDRRAERLRLAARFTTRAPDGAHAAIRSNENFRHRGHDQAPLQLAMYRGGGPTRESGRRFDELTPTGRGAEGYAPISTTTRPRILPSRICFASAGRSSSLAGTIIFPSLSGGRSRARRVQASQRSSGGLATESMPSSFTPRMMKGMTVVSSLLPPARPQAATLARYFICGRTAASVAPPTESIAPAQRSLSSGLPDGCAMVARSMISAAPSSFR